MALTPRGFGPFTLRYPGPGPFQAEPASSAANEPDDRPHLAVRREWVGGAHDLVHPARSVAAQRKWIAGDRRYWRRSATGPVSWAIVEVTPAFFQIHRFPCVDLGCPAPLTGEQIEGWVERAAADARRAAAT